MWFIIIVLAIVGICYLVGKAEKSADASAENGTAGEQFRRGEHYITSDRGKARYWFEKAANQGFSRAKARLKILDLAALNHCTKIERNGEGEKIHNGMKALSSDSPQYWAGIANHYFNGVVMNRQNILFLIDGLEQDMERAEYWFKKAADIGDERGLEGLYDVAMHYFDAGDAERSREVFLYAAEKGSVAAQEWLKGFE